MDWAVDHWYFIISIGGLVFWQGYNSFKLKQAFIYVEELKKDSAKKTEIADLEKHILTDIGRIERDIREQRNNYDKSVERIFEAIKDVHKQINDRFDTIDNRMWGIKKENKDEN